MDKTLFTIIASLGCSVATSNASVLSGSIYDPATGHNYYLLSQNTWTGAEADAQALGGDLVTINDAAENQWVFNTFSSYGGVNRLLWIGLNDPSQTNPNSASSFQWVSGQTPTYSNWNAGEPSAFSSTEYYVYMYPNGYDGVDSTRTPAAWNTYKNSSTEFGYPSPWPLTPIFGVAEVPEPSSIALVSLGICLFVKSKARRAV
jgi:hypothetical protein